MAKCITCGSPCGYTGLSSSENCSNASCVWASKVPTMEQLIDGNPRLKFINWACGGNTKYDSEFGYEPRLYIGFAEGIDRTCTPSRLTGYVSWLEYPRGKQGWSLSTESISNANSIHAPHFVTRVIVLADWHKTPQVILPVGYTSPGSELWPGLLQITF